MNALSVSGDGSDDASVDGDAGGEEVRPLVRRRAPEVPLEQLLEGGPTVCFLIASGGKFALKGPRGYEAHPDVHGLWDGEDSLMGVVLTKYKVMEFASWQDLPASCQAIGGHAQNQIKGKLGGFVVYNSLCFGLPQSFVRVRSAATHDLRNAALSREWSTLCLRSAPSASMSLEEMLATWRQ